MPIYEFECKSCGEISEKLMKISDQNPENCPKCQEGALVKIMSRTSFVLKGEGWYETDFKNKTPRPKKASEADETTKSSTTIIENKTNLKSEKSDKSTSVTSTSNT